MKPGMMKSGIVFDSRISRKITDEDLKIIYKITEEELDFITRLYQAYKIKRITKAPTLETFLKELVFSNSDLFKEKCDYAHIYPTL